MEPIFKRNMLEFMMDIRFHNNKEFMNSHRDEYDVKMKKPYYQLIEHLAPSMLKVDSGMEVRPAKCLSRIFRDTRFSHDKSPYRDHHWVAFRHKGEPREHAVMYWFEIRLNAVSWGLGFWGENIKAMDILRRRMLANPNDLLDLLPILNFYQFALEGRLYQRKIVPEELPTPLHLWYPRRDIYLVKTGIQTETVFETGIEKRLASDFLALAPFYRLLRGCYETANQE